MKNFIFRSRIQENSTSLSFSSFIGRRNVNNKFFSTIVRDANTGKPASSLPSFVKIVEVGACDGLQNERKIIPTDFKIQFIDKLSETGLKVIEPTAFVSSKWIPQMADSLEVFKRIQKLKGVKYPVLVPNVQGLIRAKDAGATDISIFVSCSETFSKQNINCSIDESFKRYKEVVDVAKKNNIGIRGYVSCVAGCPYEGEVSLSKVVEVSRKMLDLGCEEISLSDTIGVANAGKTFELISAVKTEVPVQKIAVHLHDTYGQAMSNILVALQLGVSTIDSSIAGLGGCPYARGATGNVSTEEVVYMLHGMNVSTGVDLEKLLAVGSWISGDILNRKTYSKVGLATEKKGKLPEGTRLCV